MIAITDQPILLFITTYLQCFVLSKSNSDIATGLNMGIVKILRIPNMWVKNTSHLLKLRSNDGTKYLKQTSQMTVVCQTTIQC